GSGLLGALRRASGLLRGLPGRLLLGRLLRRALLGNLLGRLLRGPLLGNLLGRLLRRTLGGLLGNPLLRDLLPGDLLLGNLVGRLRGVLFGSLLLGSLLLRLLLLRGLAARLLRSLLLRDLAGGLLRRALGGLLGNLANRLLRGLADRLLRRLLGGALLCSFLRGHEMALLVSGTIGCSSPVQNNAAGIGPTTNRRRAWRVGTDSDAACRRWCRLARGPRLPALRRHKKPASRSDAGGGSGDVAFSQRRRCLIPP